MFNSSVHNPPTKIDPIKIATIGGYGYPWFYKAIDSAAWLWSTGKCETNEIHLIFHYFPEPVTVNSLIAYLERSTLAGLIQKLKKAIFAKRAKDSNLPSYSGLLLEQDSKKLVVSNVYHKVKIYEYLKAYASASFIWIDLLIRKKRPLEILGLTHRGIRIGDIVASIALRFDFKMAGELGFTHTTFHSLFLAIFHVNCSLKLSIDRYSFVVCPDKVYLPGVLLRAASQIGAITIITDNLFHEFLTEPFAGIDFDRHIDINTFALFERYMQNRIKVDSPCLSYMQMLPKRKSFYNWNSKLVCLQQKAKSTTDIHCIIFLHQISDAQYLFGLDGYSDLVEWSDETVTLLSLNPFVTNILIKFHPANYGYYKADDIFESNFIKKFSSNSKISFVDPHTPLSSLISIPNLIGITHHGSVAEELIYLHIPVIASSFSPWGDLFDFVTFKWSRRVAYVECLENLHPANMLCVEKFQLDSLRDYVVNYRINSVEYLFRECPYKFSYYLNKQAILLDSNYNEYLSALLAFPPDSLEISYFVSWLSDPASRIEYLEYAKTYRKNICTKA